jgi:hypothetical protein
MRLSGETREDRYREWTAELHAILYDPETPSRARRGARALLYAADQNRGVRHLARPTRGPAPRPPLRELARRLLRVETPRAQTIAMVVQMVVLLVGEWTYAPHWRSFVTPAAGCVLCYGIAIAQLRRAPRSPFLRAPHGKNGRRPGA